MSNDQARVVYMPGVWDLLHFGHLNALTEASKCGDQLIVGVASDSVVEEDKGRPAIIGEEDRAAMVEALACVSKSLVYREFGFLAELEMLKPSVLVFSANTVKQRRHYQALEWATSNNCDVIWIPYYSRVSSTKIREKILIERDRNNATTDCAEV